MLLSYFPSACGVPNFLRCAFRPLSSQFPSNFKVCSLFKLYFLSDFLSFEFLVFSFSLHFLLVSSVLMVGYSEIQQTSPSVAFLFARLGAFLESSVKSLVVLPPVGTYPPIGGFVFGSGGLGLVLGDLYPLLYKSQVWFKSVREVLRREVMGSDVGSGDLERGASSNLDREGTGADTATSAPSSSAVARTFHALKDKYSLKVEVFSKFRDRFQFPEGTRAHLPRKDERACAFAYGKVCFYKAAFPCGLRFPVHPFIMRLLHQLNLAPGQLMPNSWRIVISSMVI